MSEFPTKSVLIVDDQPNWRLLFKTLLIQEGFQVLEATEYDQAKDILSQSHFDLVTIDMRLIDDENFNVQGLALVRHIKSTYPHIKTILITGYPESLGKANHNADALVLKVPKGSSFDSKGFKALVNQLLEIPNNK